MELSTLQDPEGAVSAVSSSLAARGAGSAMRGVGFGEGERSYARLATLLAIGVCAISAAGHNPMTAVADWVRRCDPGDLSRLGCPFNPLTGRYRVPDERTLREAYSRVDPAVLAAAGYGYLGALTQADPAPVTPHGDAERD